MWMATSLTAASAAVIATFVTLTSAQSLNSPSSAVNACPDMCNDAKDSWSVFNKVKRLQDCDQHMLLDFAIYNPLNEPSTTVKIRACTVPDGSNCAASSSSYSIFDKRDAVINSTALCVSDALPIDVSLDVAKSGDGSDLTFATADALTLLSTYMSSSCDLKQTFSYGLGSIVGVFSGAAVDNGGTVPYVLAEAIAIANNSDVGAPETMFVQRCVPEGSSKHIFGVAINNAGNLSWVQEAVKSWSNGVCLNASSLTSPETSTVSNITFYEYTHPAVGYTNLTVPSNSTTSKSSTSTSVSRISSSSISSTPTLSSSSIISSTTKATGTTASSSTSAGVTPPGPTQTGIISTCNKYALPVSGEGCYDFAAANGITLDQFCKLIFTMAFSSCHS
jgi:chitinase